MSAVVIDLRSMEDQRDVVHRAVQALAEGQLVVFPTETVYGIAASALHPEAVERLLSVKGRRPGQPVTLAVKSAGEARDYVPNMSPLAQRLQRRCWPGPITLVLPDDHPDGAASLLDPVVRRAVAPSGTIGLRVPSHVIIQSVLRLAPGPLALSSANVSGQPDAVTGQEVAQALGQTVDLILDDGRCRFGQPSTVVGVLGPRWEIVREGVLNRETLKRLASYMILLVCTGNTCRSPMAAVLLRRRLADRLHVPDAQLDQHGLWIASAGIAAMTGGRASPEAVAVMQQRGLDLSDHESQPLSDRLVRFADLLLTMTRGHREALLAQWPDAAARTHVLGRASGDVADPIGGPVDRYRRCADQIDSFLTAWIDELDLDQIRGTAAPGG